MHIGDIFRVKTPKIDGEHRAIILYQNERQIAFAIMTSRIQTQIDRIKCINDSEKYIQQTLVIIETHEYQSENNHKLCSLTCKTAINTNSIIFRELNMVNNKAQCDTLPKTLLKKVCDGIQISESIDEETKITIQQEYNNTTHNPVKAIRVDK